MKELMEVYDILLKAYGSRDWWPAETPYEMMIGAILTQNTAWTNVKKAIANLGHRLTPEYISSCDLDELGQLIRCSGYYNQKAARLKALTEWFGRYDYDVEKAKKVDMHVLREELLSIKGVGRETADSILVYALDKPFFVVDAYTRRILIRLGYQIPEDYDELRSEIERSIPMDLSIYGQFHALIVEHAKRYCRKVPLCDGCPLGSICKARRCL
jgi:endonuclease-3 related protein